MNESELIPYSAECIIGAPPALVLAPHPDDEVLGCAGAILAHVRSNHAVDVVVVTDGSQGIVGAALTREEIRALRAKECECAAQILGYGRPEFWNYPDRELRFDEPLVERIRSRLRTHGYRSLFLPSLLEIHPDHRALAQAGTAAALEISEPLDLCYYEVGYPLWPNRLLDITSVIQSKMAAIACFTSQLSLQHYDSQSEGLARFRSYTLPRDITHAEAYLVVKSDLLRQKAPLRESLSVPLLARKDLALHLEQTCEALATLEEKLAQERAAHRRMTDSRSWKLTAPLRKLRRSLFRSG